MIWLGRPADSDVGAQLAARAALPFSYAEVGATRGAPPAGYVVDHNRIELGHGAEAFGRACDAIRGWQMFRIGWIDLVPVRPPLAPGSVVGVLAHALGVWSLNPCRIVYVIEEHGERERFGFAYGTLPGHAVAGEERFSVEWDVAGGRVTYDLLAVSRPAALLVRAGRPALRLMQRGFAAASKRAMAAAVATGDCTVDTRRNDG